MKKEDNILSKCGNRMPFTVPEGYFDNLTENIMAALPEQTVQKKQSRIITPWKRVPNPKPIIPITISKRPISSTL